MQPTRILPDLQCSLLCEEIRQEVTGSFFLVGVVNYIRVPQLPVVAFKLSVFNRWTAGIGQFTETVRGQRGLGTASELDLLSQQSAEAQTAATLPPLQKQLGVTRDALTALLGRLPSEEPAATFRLAEL